MMAILKTDYFVPPEIEKALRDAPPPQPVFFPEIESHRRLPIREVAMVWFAKEQAVRAWQRHLSVYSEPTWAPLRDSKPKWGQPGRHRRRKARLQARRRNEARQKAGRDLEAFAKKIRDKQREDLRKAEDRMARAAFEAMKNPPTGPLFKTT